MAVQKEEHRVASHTQSPHKKRKTPQVPQIPRMGDDVIENIISYLPVRDVYALAILSKRFKHAWKFCRDLSFDKDFARNMSTDEFKKIVNIFFCEYLNTNADRFRLYFDASGETSRVSYWIYKAISLRIKELELDFSPSGKHFMLSCDLLDVSSLIIMKLVNCELRLPFKSNGLSHLRELTFQNVRARPVAIQTIFINCVELRTLQLIHCNSIYSLKIFAQDLKAFEKLVVKDCSDVHSVTIKAPALHSFHYYGKICEFKFHSELPQLDDVILNFAQPRGFQLLPHRKDLVISLAYVRSLTITTIFLEGLSARYEQNEYKELEFYLWKLKELQLIVTTESFVNPTDIVIFLKKCLRIERVFIDLEQNAFGNSLYWEYHGRSYLGKCHVVFPFLKDVKLRGFTLNELPVTMARFFLKTAIYLQNLVLVKARNHNFPPIFFPDTISWGISSNAKIEIYEYQGDRGTIMPQHLKCT